MKYLEYQTLSEASWNASAHHSVVDRFTNEFKDDIEPFSDELLTGKTILNLELAEIEDEDLAEMHFHYSLKKNGASIEKRGLISCIGENSEELDEEEAIYFSVGAEYVLHNWDVWLKWRLNRLCNPRAAGVHCSRKLNTEHSHDIWQLYVDWIHHMSSKAYRKDTDVLDLAFRYEKIELENSDYFALVITPGIDYPKEQFDPKKMLIVGSGYAEEIYGVGVSTHLDNEFAEQWNRFTELGEQSCIPPDRIWRLTAEGKDDALSVIAYLYQRYLKHCKEANTAPAEFALLPKFLQYCDKL